MTKVKFQTPKKKAKKSLVYKRGKCGEYGVPSYKSRKPTIPKPFQLSRNKQLPKDDCKLGEEQNNGSLADELIRALALNPSELDCPTPKKKDRVQSKDLKN